MGEIKALETEYAGCHFRSRLEARWALFFDRAGVEWSYENDPVNVNGEKYLPDFHIKWGTFQGVMEVKPAVQATAGRLQHVYLAGKMSGPNDWRGKAAFTGVIDYHNDLWIEAPDYCWLQGIPFLKTGPLKISEGYHDAVFGEAHDCGGTLPDRVLRECATSIRRADIFCCHIGTHDAYGTLVEIGMAFNAGKPICITASSDLLRALNKSDTVGQHDLWFPAATATHFEEVNSFESAQKVHANFIASRTSREIRLLGGLGENTPAAIVYGDPYDAMNSARTLEFCLPITSLCQCTADAARAARQARFGH